MTIVTLICVTVVCVYIVASILIILDLYSRVSKLEAFNLAVDEELPKIEHVIKTHSSRLSVNSKVMYERDVKLEKLEERVHALEINQNISRINNEK